MGLATWQSDSSVGWASLQDHSSVLDELLLKSVKFLHLFGDHDQHIDNFWVGCLDLSASTVVAVTADPLVFPHFIQLGLGKRNSLFNLS